MKRIYLILCVLFLPILVKSQIDVYLGTSYFITKTYNSSNFGINVGVSFMNMYHDFSSNMVFRKGEYTETMSGGTLDKKGLNMFNIGYGIPVKDFEFIPYVGVLWVKDVYDNGEIYSTTGDHMYNIGIKTKYYFYENFGAMLSIGIRDIKISVVYELHTN